MSGVNVDDGCERRVVKEVDVASKTPNALRSPTAFGPQTT